jgi:hypothetical protein
MSLLAGALGTTAQAQTPYCWLSCPTPQASLSGLYIGGELVKSWGSMQATERSAATNVVLNEFTANGDPLGGGLLIGVKTTPFGGLWVVSPFASFDFIHSPVNFSMPGGSYLGTTADFIGTAGLKVGPQIGPLWLYGIAGASVLNETLTVNFVPTLSTQRATTTGGTVGAGISVQPSFFQAFGRPVSVFLEYQRTWWMDATFVAPAANPGSSYTFRRQDNVVKLGFTVALDAGAPAAPMFTKAPSK